MTPEEIRIEVAPSNGRPQRLVIARHQGNELHRDTFNPDSRDRRKRFNRDIAAKSGLDFDAVDRLLDRRIVDERDKADAEAELATEEIETARQGQKPAKQRHNLPQVILPGAARTITEVAAILGKLLAATGQFFVRGGVVVRAVVKPDEVYLTPVKAAGACSDFEKVARLMKYKEVKDGAILVPAVATKAVAEVIIESQAFLEQLPKINVLSRCPVLIERDGKLVTICGYDRESGIWASGKEPPQLSLERACKLLEMVVAEFRFASPHDRSRALAALITPAMVFGDLLGGRAPIDLGEADESQSGKGFRHKLTAAIYCNKPTAITQRERGGVGGLQESFDAALVRGSPFPSLENLRGKIDCPGIESFMTDDTYFARVPYAPPMLIDPSRHVTMMTTNKAELTRDKANRSSAVRILKQPEGFVFRSFPEGDLLAHVKANQALLLGAVFTVIREWHRRGKPALADVPHDFKAWGTKLGWIVVNLLGAAPLLDDHRQIQQRISNPAETWLRDLALAVKRVGKLDEWLRTFQLLDLIQAGEIQTPGIEPGADLEDKEVFKKACQAVGRMLKQAMGDRDDVTCDNVGIKRADDTDDDGRATRKYLFSRVDVPQGERRRRQENAETAESPKSPEPSPKENACSPKPPKECGSVSAPPPNAPTEVLHPFGDSGIAGIDSGITQSFGDSASRPDSTDRTGCGLLHHQPEHWVHRDDRAYCPGCERFMGYVRGGQ